MELTLGKIRELAVRTAELEWYKESQKTDEFWESSLTVGEGFDVVVEVLDYIKDELDGKIVGVDLGSADGVVLLLMHYCGIQAYGIEKVEERVEVARRSCEDFGLVGAIGMAVGDWTEEAPYRALGIEVSDVDVFYIYPSPRGTERALALVAEKAKAGARLAVNMTTRLKDGAVPAGLECEQVFAGPMGDINVYKKVDGSFSELRF